MKQPTRDDKYFPIWSALDELVNAWEKLPGGRNHGVRDVERWLSQHMSPAINKARTALGRRPPHD
jgi:hypothetical protein